MKYSIEGKNKILISIFFSLFMISSCSTFYFEDLAHIKRGMTIEEVINIVEDEKFDSGLSLVSSDYNEDMYNFDSGNMKALIVEKEHPLEEVYYIMLFEDNKLEYWGENYHFVSHPDERISSMSKQFSKILSEHYY